MHIIQYHRLDLRADKVWVDKFASERKLVYIIFDAVAGYELNDKIGNYRT